LKEWYEKGRNNREAYYAQHAVDRKAKEVQEELVHHKQWLEQTGIRATPTVLFNGYPLPDVYRVEDLRYFAELEMK
jgi:protein-disulfide isomerase